MRGFCIELYCDAWRGWGAREEYISLPSGLMKGGFCLDWCLTNTWKYQREASEAAHGSRGKPESGEQRISLQQGANDREILRNRHEIHVHYVDLESFKKTFCLKGYLPENKAISADRSWGWVTRHRNRRIFVMARWRGTTSSCQSDRVGSHQ